jgi:hypothetical protein
MKVINNLIVIQKGMDDLQKAYLDVYQELDEATAMAKRGLDEPTIRTQIAKSTGGGTSADKATALADKQTYGQRGVNPQARQNLARNQRGDFRNTTSSNPGLHGYAHKSNDPKVKELQSARGAQRGVLTPKEKQQLNREEFDLFDYLLEYLVAEGYADTNENAIAIMANMSEEWKESIVEEYKDFPTAKVMKKAGDLMGSSAGKTDPKSKRKEQRGIKMMDTMMQHSPDR